MSTNWEDKVNKSKNIPLIILFSILLVLAIIFVCNNIEIFSTGEESVDSTQNEERKIRIKTEKKEKIKKKKSRKDKEKKAKKGPSSQKKEPPAVDSANIVPSDTDAASILKDTSKSLLSVELSGITCVLADREDLIIKIRLRLLCKGEKLRKEILLKRENLKILVKRVLKKKNHSEIIVDALRTELIKEMNNFLEQGQIENIKFLDFQPVKK